MAFNSFRQHLYRFFGKNKYEETRGMQKILNKKLLELFRGHGGTKELQAIEFFFYTDTLNKANNLAIELSAMGYEVYGVEDNTTNDQYSIIGYTPPLKMNEKLLKD